MKPKSRNHTVPHWGLFYNIVPTQMPRIVDFRVLLEMATHTDTAHTFPIEGKVSNLRATKISYA